MNTPKIRFRKKEKTISSVYVYVKNLVFSKQHFMKGRYVRYDTRITTGR